MQALHPVMAFSQVMQVLLLRKEEESQSTQLLLSVHSEQPAAQDRHLPEERKRPLAQRVQVVVLLQARQPGIVEQEEQAEGETNW